MLFKHAKSLATPVILLVLAIAPMYSAQAIEETDELPPIKQLQFQSAEIRSVLAHLADYGGVNVVVAPNVGGSVTIKLSDVLWRTAMNIIGRTYNLAIVDEGEGYIRVLPADEYRKEVTEREKHKQETLQLATLDTRIIEISNSTSNDVVEAVKSLLTERGKATSDPRSNSIILQEVPSNIDRVLEFIGKLDRPARQIKISTQLLEIYSEDLTELGVSWDAFGTYTTETGRSFDQIGKVTGNRISDVAGSYSVNAVQKGWSVAALVEAIVASGKGKVIAHPEITTIDNHQAKIQMGQKVPIKQFDESGNVIIRLEEVGTILTVTPHITAENRILMHLKPERSTYQFDPNGVIINTSNAETHVIVNNGQTAVIGGLTTQDEDISEVGVPILKDIPLIGMLFKSTKKEYKNRDLVIFVTPTIVDDQLAAGG